MWHNYNTKQKVLILLILRMELFIRFYSTTNLFIYSLIYKQIKTISVISMVTTFKLIQTKFTNKKKLYNM